MIFIAVLIGYLLGSISFSYLYGKWIKGIDIRQHGSGNAGATNTLRTIGLGPAIIVAALDVTKGILAVWIGYWFTGDFGLITMLSGLSAIAGHNWPLFFGFRGGKGIATTVGVMATLSFLPALLAGIIAIVLIIITRYVSLGSLTFTLLMPLFILMLHYPMLIFWASIFVFGFAWTRHRTNIIKLVKGKENKLGRKKTA